MKTCPKCGMEYPDTTTLCPADGIALEKTADSLLGQTLAGKYRIEERLSGGGMGTVYRATHVLMDKTVAIKVLLPSLAADEKIVARFSREARAASRISHPNALSVTDFGEDPNGIVFLVMEYLSGKTLKEVIHEEGPMPLAKVVEITRQIGGALDAAHAEGVVHRDLKSDNIMLIDNAGADFAKVLDFGIAKIKEPEGEYDPGLTAPNLVIGTPQYMSPEQCSQLGEIDSRSDIYSFGVILYEMFVGHVPFTGESPTAIMMKHLQEPVPSLLEERSDLPASVVRVVARAMAKLPENRYQKIADLVEDLTIAGAAQESSPVSVSASQAHRSASQTPSNIGDADDEVTVVRPRAIAVPVAAMPANASYPSPSISSFNPMKILIPSAAALLLIFAVIYAFTRNGDNGKNANANQPQTTLAADPNGQPVQPAEPATGKGEVGIPAGGAISPAANANLNANVKSSPTPLDQPVINPASSPNENANKNANANANNDSKTTALPSPTRNVNPEDVPAPSPSGAKTPVSKPSPVAPVPSPTDPSW